MRMTVAKRDLPSERSPLLPQAPIQNEITATAPVPDSIEEAGPKISIGRGRGVAISACIWILIFMQASNISLLTTTQSSIAEDLDAFTETSWFTSAYLIAVSSVTPLGGKMCQILSSRVYFTFSTTVFAVGTVIAGLAPSLTIFLIGRVVSGIGGAGIFNVITILILELTTDKNRGKFLGLLNAAFTIGVALGAVTAGGLAPVAGWRAMFWIQAPIGLVAGICAYFALPANLGVQYKSETEGKESVWMQLKRIDYFGIMTLVPSIVLFLYGVSSARILPLPIVTAAGLFVIFVLIEAFVAKEPVIPVAVLKSRGVLLTSLSTLCLMMARWLVLFYTPIYALAVRSWTPATAGTLLIPTNAGFGVGGLLVGLFHINRAGSFYRSCLVSIFLFAVTLFIVSQTSTRDFPASAYMFIIFLNGLVTGAAMNYTFVHMLHLVPKDLHVIVTPVVGMFRGFAGSFGSSIGGGIFYRALKQSLDEGFQRHDINGKAELTRRLLGSPALVKELAEPDKTIAITGYVAALRTLFMAGVGAAIITIVVQAGTGWRGAADVNLDEEHATTDSETS